MILEYVGDWDRDEDIKKRALGLLANLNNPSVAQFIEILIKQGS